MEIMVAESLLCAATPDLFVRNGIDEVLDPSCSALRLRVQGDMMSVSMRETEGVNMRSFVHGIAARWIDLQDSFS